MSNPFETVFRVDEINDTTQSDGFFPRGKSEPFAGVVMEVNVKVAEFMDQGWGNCKGALRLCLLNPQGALVSSHHLFQLSRDRSAKYEVRLGVEAEMVKNARRGFRYELRATVGTGGAHKLLVKDFVCTIRMTRLEDIEVLQRQNDELVGSIADLQERSRKGDDEISVLREANAELTEQNRKKDKDILALQEENDELAELRRRSHDEISALRRENDEVTNTLRELLPSEPSTSEPSTSEEEFCIAEIHDFKTQSDYPVSGGQSDAIKGKVFSIAITVDEFRDQNFGIGKASLALWLVDEEGHVVCEQDLFGILRAKGERGHVCDDRFEVNFDATADIAQKAEAGYWYELRYTIGKGDKYEIHVVGFKCIIRTFGEAGEAGGSGGRRHAADVRDFARKQMDFVSRMNGQVSALQKGIDEMRRELGYSAWAQYSIKAADVADVADVDNN